MLRVSHSAFGVAAPDVGKISLGMGLPPLSSRSADFPNAGLHSSDKHALLDRVRIEDRSDDIGFAYVEVPLGLPEAPLQAGTRRGLALDCHDPISPLHHEIYLGPSRSAIKRGPEAGQGGKKILDREPFPRTP